MGKPFYMWAHTSYMPSAVRLPGVEFDHFKDHKRILPGFFVEITIPTLEELNDGYDVDNADPYLNRRYSGMDLEIGMNSPSTTDDKSSSAVKFENETYCSLSPTTSRNYEATTSPIDRRYWSFSSVSTDDETCGFSLSTPSLLTGILKETYIDDDSVTKKAVVIEGSTDKNTNRKILEELDASCVIDRDHMSQNESGGNNDSESDRDAQSDSDSEGDSDYHDSKLYGNITCKMMKDELDASVVEREKLHLALDKSD